jgi:serine/threonine-protein kinase
MVSDLHDKQVLAAFVAAEGGGGEPRGVPLADILRARGRLPTATAIAVGKQLLGALETVHERRAIHGDITPRTVVLLPAGEVYLAGGAGLSSAARVPDPSPGPLQAGTVVATPEYKAPEQLLRDDVDARADLYAIGAVLYECLTGRPPFAAELPIMLITKVIEERPVWPADLEPRVPAPIADLVMSALEKDAGNRPQSTGAFRDALAGLG